MGSKPFSMSVDEAKVYGWDLAIAVSGFVAAWLSTNVLPQIDQSNTTGIMVFFAVQAVCQFLRSWVPNTK
jgi:hypothetical protein